MQSKAPSAITITRAQVVALEGDAVVLAVGEHQVRLPSSLVPDGIAAGHWIELRVKPLAPPPDEAS